MSCCRGQAANHNWLGRMTPAGGHRVCTMQDVGSVFDDCVFPDPVTDQPNESNWIDFLFEDIGSHGRQFEDAGNER